MSGTVRHVVRLVVDVEVMDRLRSGSPLTPSLARELAVLRQSRPWLASIGDLSWANGTPMVISATILPPSPVVTESDTEDLGMGEPESVPPAAEK
jgi:hypothetical protein